jgi:hypothetical protein
MVNLVKMVLHHLPHFFQLVEQVVEEQQLEVKEEEEVMVDLPQEVVEAELEQLPVGLEVKAEMDLQ